MMCCLFLSTNSMCYNITKNKNKDNVYYTTYTTETGKAKIIILADLSSYYRQTVVSTHGGAGSS